MASLGVFLVIVAISFAAPLYAHDIAHTDPFTSNLNGTTVVNGHRRPVMQQGGGGLKLGETPMGPPEQRSFCRGHDPEGRDVMARVLYAGRSSLMIGIGSAAIACLIATIIGVI